MPRAIELLTPSRRNFLTSSAAAVAFSTFTLPAIKLPGSPDGELIAAIAAFDAARYALDNITSPMADDDIDRLDIAWMSTIDRIEAITPQTPEGVRAKARVAQEAMLNQITFMLDADWREQATTVERLAITALRDAAGRV